MSKAKVLQVEEQMQELRASSEEEAKFLEEPGSSF